MTRDEETLFLRFLQEADAMVLREHLTLKKRENHHDNVTRLLFDAQYKDDSGYLWIDVGADNEILAAEMDVGFPTLIGLNRSPLELRILAEHVVSLLGDDTVPPTITE